MTAAKSGQLLAIAFFTCAVACTGAQQQGSVRANTLTQRAGPQIVSPEMQVKADDDKTLAGETPLDTHKAHDPKDVSVIASPVPAGPRTASIAPQTMLTLRMKRSVSSAEQRNGSLLEGVLVQPVRLASGTMLPAGTAVRATVLSSAPAGKIQSGGVLSLQVVRVGNVEVTTNVLEFAGERGKADVADAAPAKGTEAVVQPETVLHFKVLGAGDLADSVDAPRPPK